MKKVLSMVLAATLALSVTACSGSGSTEQSGGTSTAAATEGASQSESSEAEQDSAASSGDTIKIGCIQDLSATTAVTGVALAEGVRWRVEEINANGGINGKQIELIEYDSKASVDESVNACI